MGFQESQDRLAQPSSSLAILEPPLKGTDVTALLEVQMSA